jgi:hypothetical protein
MICGIRSLSLGFDDAYQRAAIAAFLWAIGHQVEPLT